MPPEETGIKIIVVIRLWKWTFIKGYVGLCHVKMGLCKCHVALQTPF